jgi:uncharacterized protein YktA (UPF0223 family)/stress response protein SCP2
MKHLITLQKKKGFYVKPKGKTLNTDLAYQIAHELIKNGYMLTQNAFDTLSKCTVKQITKIHKDVVAFFERAMGSDKYTAIYTGFPQTVKDRSQLEFVINAILYYWTNGTWLPDDSAYIKREFAIETPDFTMVDILSKSEYNSIFTDILYSGTSISGFDKEIIDFGVRKGKIEIDFNKISFNETKAYLGSLLMESNLSKLPTKDATLVLRIYSAYSGGDETLKTNTRFKNPNNKQATMLKNTLNECYNLEEAFKINREKWLRLLFYLHPMSKFNKLKYPVLEKYTDLLRNLPKSLKTFNSYIEEGFKMKDIKALDMLSKRPRAFTRKLDHAVRVFGFPAIEKWLDLKLTAEELMIAYNHFKTRKESKQRSTILTSQTSNTVVQYNALDALDSRLVDKITDAILERIKMFKNDKSVFIADSLYLKPFTTNNRATNFSLSSTPIGTTEIVDDTKTIRVYCQWDGNYDIDLSGMVINGNTVTKVGWNGKSNIPGVVYSGDNTGTMYKNAEYLDITPSQLPSDVEWIILDCVVYRGTTFKQWPGDVKMGWMSVSNPEANPHWQPKNVQNAIKVESDSRQTVLCAYNVAAKSIVYLDVNFNSGNVTKKSDALSFVSYIESITNFALVGEISWEKLNQGHMMELLYNKVDNIDEADIVCDENTTPEYVSRVIINV